MNAEQYKALTKPLRDNPKAASLVAAANKGITTIYYVAYPLLVVFLIATQNSLAWKAVVFPAVGFVLVTALRRIINRPRPYEAFDCLSVIPKDTKGKSFPSRHAYSAFAIALTFYAWCAPTGVIMVLLSLFISKTKTGKAMRAVSEVQIAAELMGISVNRTISITFAIGSALAAVAGVLYCSMYPALSPTTGSLPGIRAFTAAVFGGIGSIPGALLGGILLGVIEIFSRAYISQELSNAIVFAVLIVILLVKPNGLLGKAVREKV